MQCVLVLHRLRFKHRSMHYRRLDAAAIHKTLTTLVRRISERFPASHLLDVANELVQISQVSAETIDEIKRPLIWMRVIVVSLLTVVVGLVVVMPFFFHDWGNVETVLELIYVLEPSLGIAFFLSAIVVYLLSIERRMKRNRALHAIHELRSMAHVIDMHQLTKDPVLLLPGYEKTASSPERTMTDFELSRYFDYCTEMLSLISKVAALYIQEFDDEVAISAVDEVENLTSGLSNKIWQKIGLIDRVAARSE